MDLQGEGAPDRRLVNVSTREFVRAVCLPEGAVAAPTRAGVAKSSLSRLFVALSAERMKAWMAANLSNLGLLITPNIHLLPA